MYSGDRPIPWKSIELATIKTSGVSPCSLAIYIKKYLKAKEEDL